MKRWALGLEYDGTVYHGWQSQQSCALNTIQTQVEKALSAVADQPIEVVCGGRTDRGVHAWGQVVHFDTSVLRSTRAWIGGGNRFLPPDIKVTWAQELESSFHARYTAIARRYCYLIANQLLRPALLRQYRVWFPRLLAADRMQLAGNYLLGEHDFSAFRGAHCQAKTTIRQLQSLSVQRQGDLIRIDVQANAFLHHMVRNIVGVLLEIGIGKREPIWANEVLHGADRSLAGVTAPPHGLYLVQVYYAKEWGIPENSTT